MWDEFQVMSMERGELCQGRCMVLLLEGRMQDIGTAKPNARGTIAQALDLSPGFSDFGIYRDAFARIGGGCESGGQRVLWGKSRRGNIAHNKTDTFI